MASTKSVKQQVGTGEVGDGILIMPGWIRFKRITPYWGDTTYEINGRPTSIVQTDNTKDGKDEFAQTFFGQVTACGLAADRTHCRPFPEDEQITCQFPVPVGAWIIARKANHHHIAPNADCVQSHDVIGAFKDRPVWAPEE